MHFARPSFKVSFKHKSIEINDCTEEFYHEKATQKNGVVMERIINAEAIKHKGQYRKQGYVHYQKRLSKDQENTFVSRTQF